MALKTDIRGMVWEYPEPFVVGREQIRQFTKSIKAHDPASMDPVAAAELGYSGLVATVSGSQQTLVVALNSDLASPGQVASGSFSEAVNASNGQVRVWRSGTGDGGGDDGGEGGLVSVNFRCDNGVTPCRPSFAIQPCRTASLS